MGWGLKRCVALAAAPAQLTQFGKTQSFSPTTFWKGPVPGKINTSTVHPNEGDLKIELAGICLDDSILFKDSS